MFEEMVNRMRMQGQAQAPGGQMPPRFAHGGQPMPMSAQMPMRRPDMPMPPQGSQDPRSKLSAAQEMPPMQMGRPGVPTSMPMQGNSALLQAMMQRRQA